MDILFGKATRQLSALKNDIDTFLESSGSTSLQGQISASMTTLSKTLNDLEEMIKREVSMERRSTFKERHRLLRQDYDGYRARYEQARRAQRERERQSERDALLFRGNDPTSSSSSIPIRPEPNLNETLLKEKESRTLDYTGNRLDEYIHIGMTTLENLRNQRTTLKGTQRKLLDAATSLGLSKSVIRVIERKSAQDKFIFWTGVLVTLLVIWLMWRWIHSSA